MRLPDEIKPDNGLQEREEEEIGDATDENGRAEEQKDAGDQRGEGRPGNSDVPSKKTGPVKQNNCEETRTHRHVPEGAWLNKVRSLFKGQNKRNTETGDGGEERGDREGKVERGTA
ncbi:hypothetical protein NDU88_005517 [Pleurodeles waltl]|uniref:Uncharacterized protein n=1 Tax=Pleurodeles waltl TaxID=8319 RepID=A0AAV7RJC1_PLEWA|nr:hypothetical protein NDU88_005517 [Pleurodeles waltl]